MKTISLNGAWRMREARTDVWHDALVPGSVYADLMRDGSMPDPFWRENEHDAFVLMEKDYEYTRTFAVNEADLRHERLILRFDGLDTLAHVWLNGTPVGHADNMHVTWEWDVKHLAGREPPVRG